MGGKSERTFRIKGLNATLSQQNLDSIIKDLNEHEGRYKDCRPRTSLASLPVNNGHDSRKCGTVSCRSQRHKTKLLDRVDEYSDWPAAERTPKPLCKDTFEGMTVLHSPENADLDICFVHGLNGHAIDTFEKFVPSAGPRSYKKQPYHFWPLDIVDNDQLRTSRVLSFDYNSKLRDTSNTSGIKQWSSDILGSLHNVRFGCRDRPIIFVGYSLGGIVTRQAAADLWINRESEEFHKNVPLRNCGFMFLGTPHKGSVQANNSRVTILILDTMGFRTEMLQLFNHFNQYLEDITAMWQQLQTSNSVGMRPIVCFSEARKSKVLRGLLRRVVVARQEAAWMNGIVEEIPGSDHHDICAYSSSFEPGLEQIMTRLQWIKEQLSAQGPALKTSTLRHSQREASHGNGNGNGGSLTTPASLTDIEPQSSNGDPSGPNSSAQNLSRSGSSQGSHITSQTSGDLFVQNKALDRVEVSQSHVDSIILTSASPDHHALSKVQINFDSDPSKEKTHKNNIDSRDASEITVRYLLEVSVQSDVDSASQPIPGKGYEKNCCASRAPETGGYLVDNDSVLASEHDFAPPFRARAKTCSLNTRSPLESSRVIDDANATSHANQKDAWEKQSVLCLDGGGLRGYSCLLILRELMSRISIVERQYDDWHIEDRPWHHREDQDKEKWTLPRTPSFSSQISAASARMVRRFNRPKITEKGAHREASQSWDEPYLACHYFDYMFGTGTGGIIAIMLGRLRMSVQDCIQRYRWLAKDFFAIPLQPLLTNRFRTHEKSRELEMRLEELVENHTGAKQDPRFRSPKDLCKTCVMAYDVTSEQLKAFRTYDQAVERSTGTRPSRFVPVSPGYADTCEIWKAARATSSAPSYFKPIEIHDKKYLDGGIKLNNPAREGINEVASILDGDPSSISSLISIGCGLPKESKQDVRGIQMLRAKNFLKASALDSNSTHEDVKFLTSLYNIPYSRFDVEGLTWKLPPTDIHPDTMYEKFEQELATYLLHNEKASTQLDRCARDLVKQRRLRAQNTHRWHRFTHATFFRCGDHNEEFVLRDSFRGHLERHHPGWTEQPESQQESHINGCEIFPHISGGPQ